MKICPKHNIVCANVPVQKQCTAYCSPYLSAPKATAVFGVPPVMTVAPNPEIASRDMTLRQYAAIKLKVPDSGIDWLDEMIVKSLCDDFAAKAMHQMLHGAVLPVGYDATGDLRLLVERAYQVADAMMEARK
jgi:hypothetical protein